MGEPAIQSVCSPRAVSVWSAFLMPFLPFTGIHHLPHVHTVPPTKVCLLFATPAGLDLYVQVHAHRHLPSAVPWVSEDRLLLLWGDGVHLWHIFFLSKKKSYNMFLKTAPEFDCCVCRCCSRSLKTSCMSSAPTKIVWRGWQTWPTPCWLQVTMRLTRSVSDWQRSSSCGQSSTRSPGPGKRSETTRCCFILCGFDCLGALLLYCWLWECWHVVMQCSGLWFCGFLIDTVRVCVRACHPVSLCVCFIILCMI